MSDPFDLTAGWLEEHLLIPALYQFGLMNWEDVSYGWALFAVYGAVQVAVTFAVCLPLEHWRPVERWPDNKAVLVDIAYTVLSRVGILPFVTYVLFYRAQVSLSGWITDQGWVPPTLEGLFPFLLGQQVLTFVIYAIILDFADYVRHWLAHRFRWWWALHSLHHAQRQMTFWSDDRNHVLDDLIAFVWFGVIALLIGVPPLQFPLLVLVLRFLEVTVACQCAAVVRLAGRPPADLSAVPSCASRGAGGRGSKPQLRRGIAVVGHAVRDGRLRRRLCADR